MISGPCSGQLNVSFRVIHMIATFCAKLIEQVNVTFWLIHIIATFCANLIGQVSVTFVLTKYHKRAGDCHFLSQLDKGR